MTRVAALLSPLSPNPPNYASSWPRASEMHRFAFCCQKQLGVQARRPTQWRPRNTAQPRPPGWDACSAVKCSRLPRRPCNPRRHSTAGFLPFQSSRLHWLPPPHSGRDPGFQGRFPSRAQARPRPNSRPSGGRTTATGTSSLLYPTHTRQPWFPRHLFTPCDLYPRSQKDGQSTQPAPSSSRDPKGLE